MSFFGQPVLSIVMPFDGRADLDLALAALTVIDMTQIRKYGLPKLYQSGARWLSINGPARCVPGRPEVCNEFLSALEVMKRIRKQQRGERGPTAAIDCKDLCAWRAAELILGGENARAYAVPSEVGWHCLVRRASGAVEDPSKRLGMRARA